MKPPLTHEEWVQLTLKRERVERKQRRTIITNTHKIAVTDDKAERVLLGPTGIPVRVIEWEGGNQVEEDDRLHAHIRLQPVGVKLTVNQ